MDQFRESLQSLGLTGAEVAVHSSLRSLGRLEGGADALIEVLSGEFQTLLMPGFQCAAKVLPPERMRYRHNGCDYAAHFDLTQNPIPFDAFSTPLYPKLGMVCHTFAKRLETLCSAHPWHSWLGVGASAQRWLSDHPWNKTNRPLEHLASAGGWVLLIGVGLSSCTAVHLAEESAGRRPFIRWALDGDRRLCEVAVSGCAKGFDALMPHCKRLFRIARIGSCNLLAAPVTDLVDCLSSVIQAQPELTRCSPGCLRCSDAILRGPLPPYESYDEMLCLPE